MPKLHSLSGIWITFISWCAAWYAIALVHAWFGVDLAITLFAPVTLPFVYAFFLLIAGNSELPYRGNLSMELTFWACIFVGNVWFLMSTHRGHA